MASSSSGSSASPQFDFFDSFPSIPTEGNTTAINLGDINEDQLCNGMSADILPSQVGQTQDGFLDFGGIDNFGFGPELLADQTAESSLDPLNFDLNSNFGHLGFGLGSEPMAANNDLTMTDLMGLEGANFDLLTGIDSFPNGELGLNVLISSLQAAGGVHFPLIDEGAQSRDTVEGNASQQPMDIADPVSRLSCQASDQSDPPRTPPQTTAVSSSNAGVSHGPKDNMGTNASPEGRPHDLSEGTSSVAPKTRRSTRRKTSTTRAAVQALRQDGIRKTRKQATKARVSDARKVTRAEKSKSVLQEDAWQVVVLQNQEIGTGEIPSDSGSGNATALDSPPRGSTSMSTTEADSGISSTKRRPGRRKEVFQHVEPTRIEKGKPEWPTPSAPPPWTWEPPSNEPPKRNFLPPGPHSKKGWVLARLREPDSDRPQYGWAIGQIHDPRAQAYLILSGPHSTQVKVVREYDRIAYSPENVEKLKEGRQDKKQGGRPETVYDVVTIDPIELVQLSSVYAVLHASSMSVKLGID